MTDRFLYLVYSFILFSRFYNQLSSMPKEEGEQLQETEDEEEVLNAVNCEV